MIIFDYMALTKFLLHFNCTISMTMIGKSLQKSYVGFDEDVSKMEEESMMQKKIVFKWVCTRNGAVNDAKECCVRVDS